MPVRPHLAVTSLLACALPLAVLSASAARAEGTTRSARLSPSVAAHLPDASAAGLALADLAAPAGIAPDTSPRRAPSGPARHAQAGVVAARIGYQGQLTDGGAPLGGTHDFQFQLWDDASAGGQVGTTIVRSGVPVTDGVFTVDLDVPADAFDGHALWLRIGVDGVWLSPRQELLASPYALGLRPGAVGRGEGGDPFRSLTVINEGLGTALRAEGMTVGIEARGMTGVEAEGDVALRGTGIVGVEGSGDPGRGVEGRSTVASGVYGESDGGYGVEGIAHFSDGVHGATSHGFSAGVSGTGPTGVAGLGGVVGVSGVTEQDGTSGMMGVSSGNQSVGVRGRATGYGSIGVDGDAQYGTGVAGVGEVGVKGVGTVNFGVVAEGPMGASARGSVGDGVLAVSEGGDSSAALRGHHSGSGSGGVLSSAGGTGLYVTGHEAIHAEDTSGTMHAVHGIATGADAIAGSSESGAGVIGQSTSHFGVAAVGGGGTVDHAALFANNTNGTTGMAAYLRNSSAYGTAHLLNDGSGEVIVLQANGGRFLRAVDKSWDAKFRLEGNGNAYADGSWNSGGADVAEMVAATGTVEPGDVLVIAPDGGVRLSSEPFQTTVAGVCSTSPGFVGGQGADDAAAGRVPMAIVGIVPVRASSENGAIRPGDLLVTASAAGRAMRAGPNPPPGTVIGKAMSPLGGGVATGVIRMLVALQ